MTRLHPGREKNFKARLANARRALRLYLNPRLADQLEANPDLILARGGQRREMTVFFSDLVGFTSLAEHLSPEDLVVSLNRYFEAMEPIISEYDGILDKFDGDSIMAFWGSPLAPCGNHAALAALAALAQQKALSKLNLDLITEGQPPFLALMGINTGPMVVGNIGARKRLNYTVMGDAVNLASRLVAINKIYHTQIIISGRAAEEAATVAELRLLDRITVPGRRESLTIFEVMALKGALNSARREGREMFEDALRHYWNRDFQKALGLFAETLSLWPADGPSELMEARCREFILHPPTGSWEGVTGLTVK
jgi:adenylate cyclase